MNYIRFISWRTYHVNLEQVRHNISFNRIDICGSHILRRHKSHALDAWDIISYMVQVWSIFQTNKLQNDTVTNYKNMSGQFFSLNWINFSNKLKHTPTQVVLDFLKRLSKTNQQNYKDKSKTPTIELKTVLLLRTCRQTILFI